MTPKTRVTHYGKPFKATVDGTLTAIDLPLLGGMQKHYLHFPLRRPYTVKAGQCYFATCNIKTGKASIRRYTAHEWTDVERKHTLVLVMDEFTKMEQ